MFAVGCGGGGNNVTGPTRSQFPSVGGNYSGTTTVTFPELRESVSCPTTTTITQTGSNISIAPLQLGGACGGMSVPFGSMTIDANGSLGSGSGTYSDSCGLYNYVISGGFFGRELRISATFTSRTCWTRNFTINLVRL